MENSESGKILNGYVTASPGRKRGGIAGDKLIETKPEKERRS